MNCNCAICKNNKPFTMPEDIVKATIEGNLVLFCGAGISTENKMVMPYTLYSGIKNELGISDSSISFSSLMQKYCAQPNGRRKLIRNIKERFDYIDSFPELQNHATQFHKELSYIYPIKTIITTNWDTYFEDYCDAVPITTPEDFSLFDSDKRHVLKIHGSIDNLSTVVATTDDYNQCFERLTKGVIGANLKTILSTKTVVFIGFSFGDDDFNQIMHYIRNEMGQYSPHFYIVTLDETLQKRIDYRNCTCIVTAGTHFLHQLRLMLVDKGVIHDYTKTRAFIDEMMDSYRSLHIEISSINVIDYPCVVYTLVYQDGVLHAFERFLNGNKNGEYCNPSFLFSSIDGYEKLINQKETAHRYIDQAYYEGYLNGLVLICGFEKDNTIAKNFPLLYLPGNKRIPKTFKTYYKHLQKLSSENSVYLELAKESIDHLLDQSKGDAKDIIIHHPPF